MFRFENLDIWKKSIEIAKELFDIADDLEKRKLYKFAEQLRSAALSASNNIAEGSGSNSKKEFIQFLNFAKRSCFENANMMILFEKRRYVKTNINPNPAITIASIDCVCHCEHPEGAWQSLQKRRDCGACSERSEESRSGLLRLRLATSLAMTILIAGFGIKQTILSEIEDLCRMISGFIKTLSS